MRIAIFSDTYPPQVNGVARTLARLVAHLDFRGHQVALVTPRIASSPAPHAVWHHQLSGVPIPVYPEMILARPLDRVVKRGLEAFDPHLVHCATETPMGWSGRRWALRTGRPLVTSYHTNFPAYAAGYGIRPLEPIAWRLLRRFHGRAARTLCPSSDTLAELRDHGFHDRLGIWSRGVDAKFFNPARRSDEVRESLAPGAEIVLLYVGRLAPEKRLDLLLEAFRALNEVSTRRLGLVVVGRGPAEDELRSRSTPGVRFTGYLPQDALADAYASADIFAFPSDTETFGNVVLEAMASGLPVVGVDRGGVRDTIDSGRTGFRVTPGDAKAFAAALRILAEEDPLRLRMGSAGRVAAETAAWDEILDGVLDIYSACRLKEGLRSDRSAVTR